jgi:7-cyano-7-deazaguanine synthase
LTADYGQRAAKQELQAARNLSRYYGVRHEEISLPWLGKLGGSSLTDSAISIPQLNPHQLDDLTVTQQSARAVWVPNRNGVLINLAAAFAERVGAEQVVVGFNREEATTFPDNSLEFLEKSTEALRLSTATSVRMRSYTVNWDKKEIVAELKKLAKPFPFDMVWSCYFGADRPCGECESCQRFKRAIQ